MRALRPIAVWCLLATILAGSVAAPSLHRVQHAAEQAASGTDEPCHAPAVHHAETPLWTEHGTRPLGPECDLCATRVLMADSSQSPVVAPNVLVERHTATHVPFFSATVVVDPFIRGPPTRA
jgi:hypothetical protein